MIYLAILDDLLLMISSSTSAKEAWDKLKKIYLGLKFLRSFTILHKFLQSHQGEDENASIYLNKIIGLKTQLDGCGCNWINDEFIVFIILQSLSTKFSNFIIVIETKLNDKEEVISLDNLLRLLLNQKKL